MPRKRNTAPVGEHCRISAHWKHRHALYCYHHFAYVRRCQACGARFHAARPHTATCSDRCRQRLSRYERGEHEL